MDTDKLKKDIDKASQEALTDGHRWHLGASLIGHECERYLWNTFRWLKNEPFEGRMLRLFERGQLEEARFCKALSYVGIEVSELDPATNNQYRISAVSGHFGGSLDGIGQDTRGTFVIDGSRFLTEFKTHGDKSFNDLVKHGLSQSKPQHLAQMQTYAPFYSLNAGLYCAVNKNTDEFHFEWKVLEPHMSGIWIDRAERIIHAKTPPAKISETPTYFKCKFCHFSGVCHNDHIPEKNCRSCKMASPIDNGEWHCGLFGGTIPREFVPTGCKDWCSIA